MPKFVVTIQELIDYDIIVDAADAAAADDAAHKAFDAMSGEERDNAVSALHARETTNIEAMKDADDFMSQVAEALGRFDVLHAADFQEYCANQFGSVTPAQAAESWQRRA